MAILPWIRTSNAHSSNFTSPIQDLALSSFGSGHRTGPSVLHCTCLVTMGLSISHMPSASEYLLWEGVIPSPLSTLNQVFFLFVYFFFFLMLNSICARPRFCRICLSIVSISEPLSRVLDLIPLISPSFAFGDNVISIPPPLAAYVVKI